MNTKAVGVGGSNKVFVYVAVPTPQFGGMKLLVWGVSDRCSHCEQLEHLK